MSKWHLSYFLYYARIDGIESLFNQFPLQWDTCEGRVWGFNHNPYPKPRKFVQETPMPLYQVWWFLHPCQFKLVYLFLVFFHIFGAFKIEYSEKNFTKKEEKIQKYFSCTFIVRVFSVKCCHRILFVSYFLSNFWPGNPAPCGEAENRVFRLYEPISPPPRNLVQICHLALKI